RCSCWWRPSRGASASWARTRKRSSAATASTATGTRCCWSEGRGGRGLGGGLAPAPFDQRLQEDLVADQCLRRRQEQVHAPEGRAHLRGRVADLGQEAQEARGIEA